MKKFDRILMVIISVALIVIAVVLLIQLKNNGSQKQETFGYPSSIKYLMESDRTDTGKIYTFTYQNKTYYGVVSLASLNGALGGGIEIIDSNGLRAGSCNSSSGSSNPELCIATQTNTVIWTNLSYHPIPNPTPTPNPVLTNKIPASVSMFIGKTNTIEDIFSFVYDGNVYYKVILLPVGFDNYTAKFFDAKGNSAGNCGGLMGEKSSFCTFDINEVATKMIWHNSIYTGPPVQAK